MPVSPDTVRPHADAGLPASLADAANPAARFSDYAEIFARYDLTAISPRAVDRLTERLCAAGFEDTRFLRNLSAHGAAFQRSLGDNAPLSASEATFDADTPRDLIGDIRGWIGMARRFGHATLQARRLLGQLERIHALRLPESIPAATGKLAGNAPQTPF